VAYIDILGFSEIVKQSATDTSLRDDLAKILSEIGAPRSKDGGGPAGVNFYFQTFSDSIVASSDDSVAGLTFLLIAVNTLATKLLENKLLIRGAITKGDLYHNNEIMFGPAFLEAYEIEKTIAKYPRIVVSKQVYEDHKNSKKMPNAIRLSEDGPPFVDFFDHLEFMLTDDYFGGFGDKTVRKCHEAIQNLLDRSIYNPNHYEKLRWLAIEWNNTIGAKHSETVGKIVFPLQVEFDRRHQNP
jgi:hypothetical protein